MLHLWFCLMEISLSSSMIMGSDHFLSFLFRHKTLNLLRIFSSILPLVLIYPFPHNELCALKSPSSIISAGSCSRRSLISSYVTWSVGVDILNILSFFFSLSCRPSELLPGELFLCLSILCAISFSIAAAAPSFASLT